jgi:anti-sigma regulatory factor (Ser/Thr protein kinase)
MLDRHTHIHLAAEEALGPAALAPARSAPSRGRVPSAVGGAGGSPSDRVSSRKLALRMPREKEACPRARAAIRAWSLGLDLPKEVEEILLLLVSELVANALEHSSAGADVPIDIAVDVDGELLRAVVTDGGRGFEPCVRQPIGYQRGYGLFLLDQTASRWGVWDRGRCVWFELELCHGARPRFPADQLI